MKKLYGLSINSRVTLTATKQQAYFCYRENLWKVFNEYNEALKIHSYENSYSLTSSNPFVLRHNVWLCCYKVRKKSPVQFEAEHLEFIADTINDEITSMLENGAFEGVVYPCGYKFVVDEIKDAKNTVKIYVLFFEDSNDNAYFEKRTLIITTSRTRPQ